MDMEVKLLTIDLLVNWSTSELNTLLDPTTYLDYTDCWIQLVTAPTSQTALLSRVGVTWYTFKQKGPKFRHDWYKGAYFCKIVNFFGHFKYIGGKGLILKKKKQIRIDSE